MARSPILLACILLAGCKTIPAPPERDDELIKQCAFVTQKEAQKLVASLKRSHAPEQYQKRSKLILDASTGIVEWVGPPEDEFTGKIQKLVKQMAKADVQYDRQLEEWTEEISKLEGERVGAGFLGGLTTTVLLFLVGIIMILVLVALLAFKFYP